MRSVQNCNGGHGAVAMGEVFCTSTPKIMLLIVVLNLNPNPSVIKVLAHDIKVAKAQGAVVGGEKAMQMKDKQVKK